MRYEQDEIREEMLVAAKNRTLPHLVNMRLADYDLKAVLINVYLQGCRDMADAIANERLEAEL